MKTFSKLSLVVLLMTFGCASARTARPTAGSVAASRGAVVVDGPSVRALAAGPGTIHAYSAYVGGEVYAAPVVSGTDGDCRRATAGASARLARLQPDRIVSFDVAPGHVACLATARPGSFELLWHVTRSRPTSGRDDGSLVAQADAGE